MKTQWHKQLIFYLSIAILITSGMYIESNDSQHSYFACEQDQSSDVSNYKNKNSFITSDYCTNDLLQRNNSQYLRNNSAKRSTIQRLQYFNFSNIDSVKKLKLFYFEDYYLTNSLSSISSEIVTIKYIHRQDGAK